MSRAEIAAALAAYRAARHPSAFARAFDESCTAPAPLLSERLAEFSEHVVDRPTYRAWLVTRLHDRIVAGTYLASAEAIVEQLLGRLVAAELPN